MLKIVIKFLPVIALLGLLLAACNGSDVPSLAVPNEPTLVFIYTQP